MTMCFDCVYRDIRETSHEWLDCFCKADGKKHNPCRPLVFFDKDCPNWEGEQNDTNRNNEKTE